ncbi:MAG: glucose-6-phosphate dehydrogenase [Candidatus Woesearchaeota archaeon]
MSKNKIIIFGATGDLMKNKLAPSLKKIKKEYDLEIIAIGRRDLTQKQYKEYLGHNLDLTYKKINYDEPKDYEGLVDQNTILYLALPAELFETVLKNLRKTKQNKGKIVFEKPFGKDLKSARKLNKQLTTCFKENQIYRVDHYLGKEAVQNLEILRYKNHFLEPLLNKRHVDNIQITVTETKGVEQRKNYYDKSGAIRDMFQNHLLELLTILTMENKSKNKRTNKYNLIKQIKNLKDWEDNVVLGQYASYQKNVAKTKTETYVALKIFIENKRWQGVPIYIRTGKKLDKAEAKIIIELKSKDYESNKIIIKLQPQRSITFTLNVKQNDSTKQVKAEFIREKEIEINAYENILKSIIKGDQTLFPRWYSIQRSWQIIDRLINCKNNCPILFKYEDGSSGPIQADELLEKDKRKWN